MHPTTTQDPKTKKQSNLGNTLPIVNDLSHMNHKMHAGRGPFLGNLPVPLVWVWQGRVWTLLQVLVEQGF